MGGDISNNVALVFLFIYLFLGGGGPLFGQIDDRTNDIIFLHDLDLTTLLVLGHHRLTGQCGWGSDPRWNITTHEGVVILGMLLDKETDIYEPFGLEFSDPILHPFSRNSLKVR